MWWPSTSPRNTLGSSRVVGFADQVDAGGLAVVTWRAGQLAEGRLSEAFTDHEVAGHLTPVSRPGFCGR
ncbi:MAG TPA: hypothetical protein DEV93_14550 [Chloroflexi bacterium]|jgi:hypothetical protein|nr:hypothetical protein [Chloroflexota bacterium]